MSVFTVGTRGSALATTQTGHVAEALAALSGLTPETVLVKTEGDVTSGPLAQLGGTGVFAAALRVALLEGRCDLAVHSLKDLPTSQPEALVLAAMPERVDVRDALCARDGLTLEALPEGATIGTGSPRRSAQLKYARPDLEIVDIRGNVGTRLGRVKGSPQQADDGGVGRVAQGDLDAVVLAAAGLERLGLQEHITEYLDPAVMLPAPGQGTLAVECRPETVAAPGSALAAALEQLDDDATRLAVTSERGLLAQLEAGCAAPIGALARIEGETLVLDAVVCAPDGSDVIRRSARTRELTVDGARALGVELAELLLREGAADLAGL
ncbi:hydroxymethylbilane synthase [Zhihengliuella salsuginis]|uniref:Porphobilinogen deaminase n=1 Tax=Zhihengliuella salsuginis TaxID=578222 RepID=A0ABQ3GEM4_9MICC|nr:hydroxymethylbilane synthase [Zhihengliuella salsuginis]GHD03705.1 porphobilinogen deaminase 1 [Zhihengliuella salsuginis]